MGVEIQVNDLTKSFGKQLIWGDVTLTVPAGETVEVPVYVRIPAGTKKPGVLKLTASSETDSSKSASGSATVTPTR